MRHPVWITAILLTAAGLFGALSASRSDAAACAPPPGVTVSCAARLAITLPASEPVGRYIDVPLRDRWGIGDLALTICEQPPGGARACRPEHLRAGQARGSARLDLRRPGGYEISVTAGDGGATHSRLIWASHPHGRFTLLAAGDSEMEVLDDDLRTDLAPYGVTVDEDARPSTGLTVPGSFSWLKEATHDVSTLHPDVTIMAMGANEGYAIPGPNGVEANCCGAAWQAGYGALVLAMSDTFLEGHAGHLYWMVLPTPKPAAFQSLFNDVNRGIELAASRTRDRVNLLDARAVFTPQDVYRNVMTFHGQSFTIHEPDGIHLDATADAVEAALIVQRLLTDHEIRPLVHG